MTAKSLEPNTLLIPPRLAMFLGKSAAIFLQQLHYWLQKSNHIIDGLKWVYNSYREWADQIFCLSASTIKRAVAFLKELNLIKTERHSKSELRQVNWYSINYERLELLIASIGSKRLTRQEHFEQLDLFKMTPSSLYTEISTENSLTDTDAPAATAAEDEIETETAEPRLQDPGSNPSPDPNPVDPQHQEEELSPPPPAAQFSAELIELKIEDNRVTRKEMERYRDRIPDALAYVRQEVGKRWVKRPTGLFVKALRKGYKPQIHPSPLTPHPSPQRIDFGQVEHACVLAMQLGDRAFVQAKLESLCAVGLASEAEQICHRHDTWGFFVENAQVEVF